MIDSQQVKAKLMAQESLEQNEKIKYRDIPYNYTSADDQTIVEIILGQSEWEGVTYLREHQITGKTYRLLMKFLGDIFIHIRNPFLYEELMNSRPKRIRFFSQLKHILTILETRYKDDPKALVVVSKCKNQWSDFKREVTTAKTFQQKLIRQFAPILKKENISFLPIDLVAHSTDATDWRLHPPLAVLRPSTTEEISNVIKKAKHLGVTLIPRGGGTGLTGGAVALTSNSIIINTEKLNTISSPKKKTFHLNETEIAEFHTLEVGSGAITEDVMHYAKNSGLVFATDPTSAWASTIGGNLAENAGGKTAVLWGTAIDNILAYTICMPNGAIKRIERLNHQGRKILPGDEIIFQIKNEKNEIESKIVLHESDIRKKDLGKDVTNKTLKGLPGLQKEGTDGVITSAEFILYPEYKFKKTICLEFFGSDMQEASVVIEKICSNFPLGKCEVLSAMEHFDDKYVEAISYQVKTLKKETPKAVLLIDISAHTDDQLARALVKIGHSLTGHKNTFLHVAKDSDEANLFWQDRKKLGALAARTNAFKLNEDIVLPIKSLADFAKFCEEINEREKKHIHNRVIASIKSFFDNELTTLKISQEELHKIESKITLATEIMQKSDSPSQLKLDFTHLLRGHKELTEKIQSLILAEELRLIVVATHMHAGDGNVHVNIPVFSNDKIMLERADHVVDEIMFKTHELKGVVSGEHGIGLTKIKYLDSAIIADFKKYKENIDPQHLFNPQKLLGPDLAKHTYTPSFNLLEMEARILKYGNLEQLLTKISKCIRCGKCKEACPMFFPEKNLFFHPRDKNLAICALMEALLYNSQRERNAKFAMLTNLGEVADHCTVCHKCEKPCPVAIDSGEVSILEREILSTLKVRKTKPITTLTLRYLSSKGPFFNSIFRTSVLSIGSKAQRYIQKTLRPWKQHLDKNYLTRLVKHPMAKVHSKSLNKDLPKLKANQGIVLGAGKKTVFYFPGCGSERLFSDISRAGLYLLLKNEIRVVLPPSFLCCGLPLKVNAKIETHEKTILANNIIFSQIKSMLNYFHFDSFLVSCGTCMEELAQTGAGEVFKTNVEDIFHYLSKIEAPQMKIDIAKSFLYHPPCHDSLNGKGLQLLKKLGVQNIKNVPHCCSEAGTLALSRPDISDSILEKKSRLLKKAQRDSSKKTTILTNCPSCIQGLCRQDSKQMNPEHILIELAKTDNDWKKDLKKMLEAYEIFDF